MKEKNVLEKVKDFCNQKNTVGALLITGEWGCGKSYFIENEFSIDNDIKNKFAIIKISLFGIETAEQFNIALKKEYLKVRSGFSLKKENEEKVDEGFNLLKKTIQKFVPYSNMALSMNWSVFVSIKKFDDKDILLVFDDLERCKLDIDIILGLLNEYIEKKQFKTIIIANEENIIRNELKKDSQNITYTLMKEKIISRTIKLLPDYNSVIKNIIDKYIETEQGYKQFLCNNSEIISKVFLESKLSNIRSLKCAIQDFEMFFNKICSYISDNKIKSYILYDFLAIVFEYKNGNIKSIKSNESNEDSNNSIYGKIFEDEEIRTKYKSFNSRYRIVSMENWILKGECDTDLLETDLKKLADSLKETEPKNILLNSTSLMFIDDKILDDGFVPLLEDAYKGILELNNYMSIFRMIISARRLKIKLPCNIENANLKKGVERRIFDLKNGIVKETISYQISVPNGNKQYLLDDEVNIVESIEKFREEYIYISNRPQIIEALKSNKHNEVNEMVDKYTGAFDKEYAKIIGKYYLSLENEKKQFFSSLLETSWDDPRIYSEKNIDVSIEGLGVLKDIIKPSNNDGKISTALNRLLSEKITKVIDSYISKKDKYNKEIEGYN